METETAADQLQTSDYLRTDDLAAGLGHRTARGGLVTMAGQGAKLVLSMTSAIVLARLLTPTDYGLVGMVTVITGFITIFKDLGLSSATIQQSELNDAQVSTLFWINVAASTAIMAATVALAPAVAWFYGEPRLLPVTMAFASGFFFAGLTVQHEALLKRRMQFGALAVAEVSALTVGIVVSIVLAWMGAKYWALVAGQLGQGVAYMIGVWTICPWRPHGFTRGSGVRSMVVFGRDLTGFNVANYFSRNLDNLLIGRVWGSVQLGLYSRAYQLLMLPIDQINSPVSAVAVPALSRLTEAPDRYRSAYLRLVEKIALVTMPLMAFLIVTSDWIVSILLGPKWTGVTRIFQFLAIAGFVQPACGTTGWLFITQGRGRDMFRWGLVGSTIIVASIVAGLPWGATGVALSYATTFVCVVAPLLFWFVGRSGPVRARDVYRTIAPAVAASLVSMAAAASFRTMVPTDSPVLGVLMSAAVCGASLILTLLAIPGGRRGLVDLSASLAPYMRNPKRLIR